MRIAKQFTFEAAHYLPNVPEDHQCRRVHGHSYRVEVVVEGPVDPVFGWVVDFAVLSDAWKSSGGRLDHTLLNDALDNPTAENLATVIAKQLNRSLVGLVEVSVWETATARATWRP